MGTRSTIWMENEDGSATGIYCHYDGYPSNNGKILLDHYTDKEKVEDLISLGALSILDAECCPPPNRVKNDFDNRTKGYTVAYCRDRGEDMMKLEAPAPTGRIKLFDGYRNQYQEYNYLFKYGKWYLLGKTGMRELTQKMCK